MEEVRETTDIFLWANQTDAKKNDLQIELFLFNKNYTPYFMPLKGDVEQQLRPLFLFDYINQVNLGAGTGLSVRDYELSEAEDNVLLPCHFSAIRRERAGSQPRETARRLLAALELPESAWSRPVTGLSVGQQQRAAVARALIGSPELLIADEPTSALDSQNRNRLLSLLMAQLESSGATLLVVSHDEQLRPYFGRILQMDDINTAEAA